jgi:FixJ family two-component response regulator
MASRVFVVDDDPSVRESLGTLLVAAGHEVETFPSAQEFLAAYDNDQPGCLLLDISMPGMSGLELQARLNERRAILPIIFMTGHGDVPTAVGAMLAGATDFLQKSFRDHELLDKVSRALAKDAANRAVLGEKAVIRSRFASLTPREMEVMHLVVEGKANKVIAGDLALSQRTVEIHRGRVMEKMEAASLAHLVRMVLEAGED